MPMLNMEKMWRTTFGPDDYHEKHQITLAAVAIQQLNYDEGHECTVCSRGTDWGSSPDAISHEPWCPIPGLRQRYAEHIENVWKAASIA